MLSICWAFCIYKQIKAFFTLCKLRCTDQCIKSIVVKNSLFHSVQLPKAINIFFVYLLIQVNHAFISLDTVTCKQGDRRTCFCFCRYTGMPSTLRIFTSGVREGKSHPGSGSDRTIASERRSTALAALYIGDSVTCSQKKTQGA